MSIQKRRMSKSRGRKRRTHWKAKVPNLISCPNCGALILPHTRCSNCGHYKGREVIVH